MDDRGTCTVALARRDADQTWHLEGSGVCTMIDGCGFVLSAGRLLATVGENLWLGGAGKRVKLMSATTFREPSPAPEELQKLDMGFAPLLQHEMEYLDPLEYVSPEVMDLEDEPPGQDYLVIAASDTSGAAAETTGARHASRAAYTACGVDPATHVVVDSTCPPGRQGLLGAGVWRPSTDPAGELLTGIVVAVVTTEDASRARLVATRAPLILIGVYSFIGMRLPRPPRSPRRRVRRRKTSGRAH